MRMTLLTGRDMPIKFRCNYCHQFLGISRNRAGGVVDCPTCGRSIRVPELDGSAAPVPEPELDGADAHLARALDELAALANYDVSRPVRAGELAEPETETPQPLLEAVPLEIPLPVVQPISVPVGGSAAVSNPSPAAVSAVLDELVGSASAIPVTFAPPSPLTNRNGVSPLSLGWLACAPVAALLIGLWSGWLIWSGSQSRTSKDSGQPPNVAANAAVLATAQVQGRITYQTEAGDIRPDIGACVLVFPRTWDAASRLAPVGLRPADADADQTVAVAVIEAMGGKASWTNAGGVYTLSLPVAGTYRVVILSRLSARRDDADIPAADQTLLQAYLTDPEATIGRRSYAIRQVEAVTTAPNTWDHQFVSAAGSSRP